MNPLARDVGPWTIVKFTFLREYLNAYVDATKRIRTRSDVCFMDIFAGPGHDRERDTGHVVDGSPLIAMSLHSGFGRFIFLDIQEKNIRQLEHEAATRGLTNSTHTIIGDCNLAIDEALSYSPRRGATFCFIDPASGDAHWSTIKKIAQYKPEGSRKVELFILFPYDMALVRFLARSEDPQLLGRLDTERRMNAVMPDTVRWKAVYQTRNRRLIRPSEARRRFAYIYWMGLKDLGYQHVLQPKLLTTPKGRPLYFLYFASDHPAGERIMSHVLNKSRETNARERATQLEMQFSEEELLMPNLTDPWEFREGEPWYDALPPPI